MKSFVMSVVAAIAFTAPPGHAATPSPDYAIAKTVPLGTPRAKNVCSSNRDGPISVVQELSSDSFELRFAVKTKHGARTMAIDSRNDRIYMATADIAAGPKAAPNDNRHRYSVKPGTVRLLLLDPKP